MTLIRIHHALVFSASILLEVGCAHYPDNARMNHYDPQSGYRFRNLSNTGNSDSLQIFLAFSGGGTRAAALSYGVLEELARTQIVWEGQRRRLLDEVDYISAVSGGSFTAAYYALYRDRIFADFEDKFLNQNNSTPTDVADVLAPVLGKAGLALFQSQRHGSGIL